MVMTAFKSPVYVYSYTIWFPPTLENFREVFNERWRIGEQDHQQHGHRGLDGRDRDPDRRLRGLRLLAPARSR